MANNPQFSSPPRPRTYRRQRSGAQMMLYGIVLALAGVVLTVIVQAIATSTGSNFTIIFSGMIIIGIIYAIIGFFRWILKR